MQTTPGKLRPALNEVQRTAHDQDLIEVPKRARLDREAEGIEIPTGGAEAHGANIEDKLFNPATTSK
ncbi:MAG: hypothetical protein WBE72_15005 [Terracidiphilus sp.]